VPVCYRHPDKETWIRCQRCEKPICPDCMRDASVGFQCPDCVKEGARSTRQGKAVYGGKRLTGNPMATTFALIAANLVGFFAIRSGGGRVLDALALLPQSSTRGFQEVEGVSGGAYWQVLTSAFSHYDVLHLGFNMLALYFLGPMLEQVLGRLRFLAVYFVSAFTASAAVMLVSNPNSQTLGASGAIFGLMGALVVVAFKVKADLRQILFWLGLNLVFTFYNTGSISWQGHLGGLLGGALTAAIIVYAPRKRREVIQWTGIALVLVVALVVIAAQAVVLG
jgi:membrane associated rhomboid family serine protease